MTFVEQINMYEAQIEACRKEQCPGNWLALLGELDAEAELFELRRQSPSLGGRE